MTQRRSSENTHRDAGFTLVETLISVFVLALIMGAGSALLLSTLRTNTLVETRMEVLANLEITSAHLQSDLTHTVPRLIDGGSLRPPQSLYGGRPDRDGVILGLVRDGWVNLGDEEDRGNLTFVTYRLDEGRLIRRIYERPDRSRRTPAYETALLGDLENATVSFTKDGLPVEEWEMAENVEVVDMPETVIFEFEFTSGERLTQTFLVGARS